MIDRSLEGCNEILEDNPFRWLVTISLVPLNQTMGVLTETRIIETEPSLWWRSEKWQEFEEVQAPLASEDAEPEKIKVPRYRMCLILNVHEIG